MTTMRTGAAVLPDSHESPSGGSRLLSVGTSLPEGRLSNADLEKRLDTTDEWIRTRTGISERRTGSSTVDLAEEAARQALADSGLEPRAIGLLIVATQTPDEMCPSTAAIVHHRLGLTGGAFDLNAACSGFVYALVAAHHHVGVTGSPVLVVGVDRMSAAIDWTDRASAVLFGDGAGAVVVGVGPDDGSSGIVAWDQGADGAHRDILRLGCAGVVEMNGKEVFRHLVRRSVESARITLERAEMEVADIAAVLAHQGNQRILDAVADRLGVPEEKMISVIGLTGNTSAGSVPLALRQAVDDGRIGPGDHILFAGFGGGLAWASAVAVWG